MLDGEVTLWDVPDVLPELSENWAEVSDLLRVPSGSGVIESLDFVLCGDRAIPFCLQALASVFRARMFRYLQCLNLIKDIWLGNRVESV